MINLLFIVLRPAQEWKDKDTKIFDLCEDITIADEGLQNLGLCSVFRASEQEGMFIMQHQL
jgi:hypothetical protein